MEEGLLDRLAQKRHSVYESKKESLRREIEQLRDFFSSMEKERELLECQVKATQALCCRKLVKAEKELQAAQSQLRDTQNEAASLLECKHQEMERIQKERDEFHARLGHLTGESDLFRGYSRYLEEKICSLVSKLHEYHHDLQKKTEEIVGIRKLAVGELEWVKQSMIKFEQNLLNFNCTNSRPQCHITDNQLPPEKNQMENDLVGMKQLESSKSHYVRSTERIADAAEDELHNINQRGLLQKLQKLEEDLECANQRANSANFKLNDADVTISNLQASVSRLQEEIRNLKEKNLEYVTEKIEAEAGEQLKEAAISVLRLRIFALEGDLQQERHTKGGNSSLNPKNKSLTQLSPDIDVEIKTRAGLVFKRDANHHVDSKAGKQDTAKYQLHQDAGTLGSLRKVNGALKPDLQTERAHTACAQKLSSDAWSVKKMKKLEQALVEARERYTSLWREMNELRSKNMLNHTAETSWKDCEQTFKSHAIANDLDTSQLVDELLGDHNKRSDNHNWRRDGNVNPKQYKLDQKIKVPPIF